MALPAQVGSITGGAAGGGNGGGSAILTGANTSAARSRNSEYNFFRDQTTNATSLPRESRVVTEELISGYQTITCDGPGEIPDSIRGNISIMASVDANVMANHGMI